MKRSAWLRRHLGRNQQFWHHNLLAHHSSRTPRIEGDVVNNVDLRNVIYNWVFNSGCYGGEKATVNIVNCYYKYGPATQSQKRYRIVNPSSWMDELGTVNTGYGILTEIMSMAALP